MQKADIILQAKHIFTGLNEAPFSGFVAVKDNKILTVGKKDMEDYIDDKTSVIDLGEQTICPGFVDVHCFFTGYLLTITGKDFSHCTTEKEVIAELQSYISILEPQSTVLARGLKPDFKELTTEFLDHYFHEIPVILFHEGGESCYMNTAARQEYQFTPETCYSESYWRLLRYILNNKNISVPEFKNYMKMMNSCGITSVKEMGFDDFYGFTDVLKDLEDNNELSLRVHFMSQPVGAPMNLEYGRKMRSNFNSHFLSFSGYNQMTDGSISQYEGDMKQPYLSTDFCCKKDIDWDTLRKDALAADAEGFRFSLHAQGDGAIEKTISIFEQCQKAPNGKLLHRHAITDLECADPSDLERMGYIGIIAEIYPQIMSIADRQGKIDMINQKIGMERGKNYWNRRKMADCNITISCGTDLPLLYDDIPEAIYHSVGAQFPEGGEPFNKENTLTIDELLKAWTYGGQYNLGNEEILGTLETGKLADIAVLDANIFNTSMKDIRNVSISLTMVEGKIVYQK